MKHSSATQSGEQIVKQLTKEQEAKKTAAKVAIIWDRIEEAKRQAKSWYADTKASIEEASKGEKQNSRTGRTEKKGFPIWWASIRTVQPALYSRTPNPISRAMLTDIEDAAADLASICHERIANQLIEACPFDRVMGYTRDMYLHSGRTAPRVVYDAKFTKEIEQEKIYVQPTNEQPLDGNVQYQQDEQGIFYIQEKEVEKLETDSVFPQPLHYTDMLHSPNARWEEEIDWKAYKALMSKHDVAARFGEEIAGVLQYTYNNDKDDKKSSKNKSTDYCCIWEYWNKKDKKVYWLCESYKENFLDIKDDPYQLVGFFPSPPMMIGTTDYDNLYPVPDFVQVEPLIKQLNGSFDRYRRLLLSLKRKGIYDQKFEELKKLGQDGEETEFIGIKNFRQLIQEGGLDNLIHFFPVKEFSEAVIEVANSMQDLEQKFYDLYGIPDILRGVSDPRETAEAQQQKGRFISLRFSAIQKDFQKLARDTIELMCDLALKFYDDQKLADICGYRFMTPEQQALFPEVLQILRNDQQRQLRIDIETDSTITMNEQAESERRKYLADVINMGIPGLANPEMSQAGKLVIAEALNYYVRGLSNGKQVQASLSAAIKELKEPPPPPEPPPPDPMMQKIQIDAQLKTQELQQDGQIRQAELQLKGQTLQLEQMKLERDFALKEQELIIESQKVANESNLESVKVSMAQQQQLFQQEMDKLKQELDSFKVVSAEQEKRDTERRLEREEQRQQFEMILRAKEATKQDIPPINLTVEAAKPTKKKATVGKDEFGNTVIQTEELGQ